MSVGRDSVIVKPYIHNFFFLNKRNLIANMIKQTEIIKYSRKHHYVYFMV